MRRALTAHLSSSRPSPLKKRSTHYTECPCVRCHYASTVSLCRLPVCRVSLNSVSLNTMSRSRLPSCVVTQCVVPVLSIRQALRPALFTVSTHQCEEAAWKAIHFSCTRYSLINYLKPSYPPGRDAHHPARGKRGQTGGNAS